METLCVTKFVLTDLGLTICAKSTWEMQPFTMVASTAGRLQQASKQHCHPLPQAALLAHIHGGVEGNLRNMREMLTWVC